MLPPSLNEYDSYVKRRDREQPQSAGHAAVVSIVTVMLNSATTLERTILSVQSQTYPSIEHVFVDGGSTDGTLDIVRKRARSQDFWISEKDKGISDAFNKGVAMARGRFVLILNADDWLSTNQIEQAVNILERSGADFAFGDLLFYQNGKPEFRYVGDPAYARAIRRRCPAIGHPTVLARKSCFDRIGLFDANYRNAMDYDWLLRLHCAGGWGVYSPKILGHMTHEGVSNRQFGRTIEEVRRIVVAQGHAYWLADVEARFRYFKTVVSQPIRYHGKPLYRLLRRVINPSYRPVSGALE